MNRPIEFTSKNTITNSFGFQVSLTILFIIICELLYYASNRVLKYRLDSITFGNIFTCFAAIEFLGSIMLQGVDILLFRELPFLFKNNLAKASLVIEQTRRFLKKTQFTVIVITVIICLVSLLFKTDLINKAPFLFILYLFPCCTWYYKYQAIIRSIGRTFLATSMDIGQKFIFLILSTVLMLIAGKVTGLLLILVASLSMAASYFIVALVIKVYFILNLTKQKTLLLPKTASLINFMDSLSFTFQRIGMFGFNAIPMIIYELFSHDHNGGTLATIIVITSLVTIPIRALSPIFAPDISLAMRSDYKTMRSKFREIRMINVAVAITSGLAILPFANFLLHSFGELNNLSYYCLILWLTGALLNGSTSGSGKIIQFSAKSRIYGNLVWIIVLSWQTVSSIFGTYFWGIQGLVYAHITTNTAYVVVIIYFSRKIIKSKSSENTILVQNEDTNTKTIK